MHVGELLLPIVEAMRRDLLMTGYLQADETTVQVQTRDKSGGNHQFIENESELAGIFRGEFDDVLSVVAQRLSEK